MQVEKTAIALIASFTDFGSTGPYQGQMAAVLATQAPSTPQVSLMSDAPMFNPHCAGLLLTYLCDDLPANALIVAVVDPGVGGNRRPVMVKTDRNLYVGPDNGLFIPAIHRCQRCEVEIIVWRPERLSESFHGRDLFAPVAAKLANGEKVEGMPLEPQELVGFDSPYEHRLIIYIDHYGNGVTNINANDVNVDHVFSINGKVLRYARTFAEVPLEQAFWYINSMGLVEFAVNCGSAADSLQLELGMPIEP